MPQGPQARRRLHWFLLPFVVVFVALWLVRVNRKMSPNEHFAASPGTERSGRVVFVMVDSLTASLAEDVRAFPSLDALRPRALWGRIAGCLPASTVACTRTMLEGSSAGYVASLDNFAARRIGADSFPVIARAAGLRVAVVSDHTFTHMLGELGGPRVEYVEAGVPVYAWDEAALSHVGAWLTKDVAEVLLVHLVDLDKASHSPGPGTPRYAEEVRGADAVLGAIAKLLRPGDSLLVAGDHGHDEFGNHTPDPGYLAFGPAFAPGRRDIEQATVGLLLSAAAATSLPPAYDGEVPKTGLVRPFGGSLQREAAIRRVVERGREARRGLLRRQTLEFMPGLALAALSLGWLFPSVHRRRWPMVLVVLATVLSGVLGFGWASVFRGAFWLGPASNFLHYLLLFAGVVGAVAFAARRAFDLRWSEAAGAGVLAFPLLVHLTGDDYFSSARMLCRLLPLGVVLLLFMRLRARDRSAILAFGASLVAMLLCELRGPATQSTLATALLSLAGSLLLYEICPWLYPMRLRFRLLIAALPLVLAVGMRHPAWATLVLALGALPAAVVARDKALPAALRGAFVAATSVATFWAGLGSLRFDRIRFEFALAWLPTVPNEALLAALATPLSVLKYALVVFVPLSLSRLKEPELRESVAFFCVLPALSATAFVAGATTAGGSRYHETAIQEASLYAAIALLSLLVLWIKADPGALSPAAPAKAAVRA